jgi:hypothetical protein
VLRTVRQRAADHGNVTGFLQFGRDTCQHFTYRNLLTVLDHDQRADLKANRHGVFGAGDLDSWPSSFSSLTLERK